MLTPERTVLFHWYYFMDVPMIEIPTQDIIPHSVMICENVYCKQGTQPGDM